MNECHSESTTGNEILRLYSGTVQRMLISTWATVQCARQQLIRTTERCLFISIGFYHLNFCFFFLLPNDRTHTHNTYTWHIHSYIHESYKKNGSHLILSTELIIPHVSNSCGCVLCMFMFWEWHSRIKLSVCAREWQLYGVYHGFFIDSKWSCVDHGRWYRWCIFTLIPQLMGQRNITSLYIFEIWMCSGFAEE